MTGTSTLLVVEYDTETRSRLVHWLNEAGFVVLTCPGPLAPDYTCHGSRGELCPFAELADIVVLDLWLDSDLMMEGTPGWQLLSYYQSIGKPVVALIGPEDAVHPIPGDSLALVRRPAEREALLQAVRGLVGGVPLRRPRESLIGDLAVVRDTETGEKGATRVGVN